MEEIFSMNKSDLISSIASKTDMSKADTEKFLNAFTEAVKEAMAKKDKITLVGFGTFSVAERAARKGRNPQTGADIEIPAANVPKFKAGAELKGAVN